MFNRWGNPTDDETHSICPFKWRIDVNVIMFFNRSKSRLRQACRTILATSGKLTGRRWNLFVSSATANLAKSGKVSGTTQLQWQSKRSNLVNHLIHCIRNCVKDWTHFPVSCLFLFIFLRLIDLLLVLFVLNYFVTLR